MNIMNNRKLVAEPVESNETDFCATFCNPARNLAGICTDICVTNCPSSNCPPHQIVFTVHHKSDKLHQQLTIALTLIGLACFFFCIFTLYKYIKNKRMRRFQQQQQQRHVHDHDHVQFLDEEHGLVLEHPIWYIRTIGLPPSTIDLITVVRYKKGEGLVEGTDCSVCLSEFEDDETLRLLPKCNHAFHVPCIDTWLGSHTNCPMCRAPIVSTPNGTIPPVLEQGLEEDSQAAVPEVSEERESENTGLEPKGVGSSQQVNNYADGIQPMKRSVSMNSLAASRLSSAINMSVVPKRLDLNHGLVKSVGGSSFRSSLQQGPIFMKRSVSCSGKVFFSRHNRGRTPCFPSEQFFGSIER